MANEDEISDEESVYNSEDPSNPLNCYPTTIEPEEMKKSFFTDTSPVLDWRLTLDPQKDLPQDPELKKECEKLLDDFNQPDPSKCLFAHCKNAWRHLNIEPVDVRFKSNDAIVARPIRMNEIRSKVLDFKIDQLFNADLIEELSPTPNVTLNVNNCFVVPHNREAKITYDSNQIHLRRLEKY